MGDEQQQDQQQQEDQAPGQQQPEGGEELAFPDLKPGIAWGESITKWRADELAGLAERQRAWAARPDAERGDSVFKGMLLTGADVFWLAAYALAGPRGGRRSADRPATRAAHVAVRRRTEVAPVRWVS